MGFTINFTIMQYIYFRIWNLFRSIPTNNTPAANAIFLLSIIQFMNILTVIGILSSYLHFQLNQIDEHVLIFFSIIVGLFLYVVNFLLLYKRRETIDKKYSNESHQMKVIGLIILCSYFILSFTLLVIISKTLL